MAYQSDYSWEGPEQLCFLLCGLTTRLPNESLASDFKTAGGSDSISLSGNPQERAGHIY